MKKKEYHYFITCQLAEIKKYLECKKLENSNIDENLVALEWIEKNAKQFRENWKG